MVQQSGGSNWLIKADAREVEVAMLGLETQEHFVQAEVGG